MTDTPEPAETPTEPGFDELEALRQQINDAEARAAAAQDAQLRAVADLENTRRRLERDAANSLKYAAEKLLGELLAVADSLELGLKAAEGADGSVKAMGEGMELTYRQLMSVLEKNGVKQLDPTGQPFNPDFHQAMSMAPSADVPANHVLAVMQKGYSLHERLLRPAMVVVARAPE
ncbi:nucleotide exchange factor GrpE [Solimonas marina]|uniref:Protein GrpE n=1 Tax=Solimonas marina TaxID=2714601 RepID=A0A969WBP1_9GAMM|nr:nucleotide exchange factor GrpE [Solimonas marina]NKF23155.1 nucleotide exchange factor GrpE [Solimonas marina]